MTYYNTLVSGDRIPLQEGGYGLGVEQVTEARTLRAEDSGKVLVLNAAEGVQIDLPAVQTGLNYRIVTGLAFDTTAWTVVATTAVIQGSVIVDGAHVAASNGTTISFVETAESLGDYIDLVSDGTNWYLSGSGVTAGSITIA